MTIGEAIEKAHQYRPNHKAEDSDIIRWLNEVDSRIQTDIYDAYFMPKRYIPYTIGSPTSAPLLAEPGFERMYNDYLCASIDLLQGDYERYNESIARFNNAFEEYSGYIARTHLPKHRHVRYF